MTVVSKAFEGKGGKKREKLVLQVSQLVLQTTQVLTA